MEEPGFKASESTALMTMIPISAVGQEENLWLILRFDEDRSMMNHNSCHIQSGHLRVDSDGKSMSAERLGALNDPWRKIAMALILCREDVKRKHFSLSVRPRSALASRTLLLGGEDFDFPNN